MRRPCATSVCLVAALLSLLPSWEAQAQESVTAKVGDRVRVSARLAVSGPITGTLRKIEAGSITVGRDDAGMGDVEVRVSQIEAVQLFVGTRNRARRGLLIGVAAGIAAVSYAYLTIGSNDARPSAAVPLAIIGTSGFLGFTFGANFKTDIWKDVSIEDLR